MIKYINGKVEIWFNELPPTNINSVWMYKKVIGEGPEDYIYEFKVYNRHKNTWEAIVDAETYEMVAQYPTMDDFPLPEDANPTKLYVDLSTSNAYFFSGIGYYKITGISPEYMNTDGSNSNVNTFVFDTTVESTTGLLAGQMRWVQEDGTVNLGMNGGDVQQSIGLEIYYRVTATAQIKNGYLVQSDGTHGNSGMILAKHAGPGINPRHILGIATHDINTGESGFVTWFGKIRHIKTNGNIYGEVWSDGNVLYQHPSYPGALTNVQPPAPYNKAPVAIIIHAHSTNGSIFVRIQRSLDLNAVNDVNIVDPQAGQVLTMTADGLWENSSSIAVNEIQPQGGVLHVPDSTINTKVIEAPTINTSSIYTDNIHSINGYKIPLHTDDDILTANGGTLPITTLKSDVYQLYNPSNNTQVVLEVNAAGEVLVHGPIVQTGTGHQVDFEKITTKEQLVELRNGATTGMPIGDLAGFIIKLYDGSRDGYIVIDNEGVLRIGDDGDLQPVLTREESPVDQSPLFFNNTTKRSETLPGTTTKSSLADLDAVMVKDSADSYKPKWWTFANIKANLKSYFDTLFVQLANVNQTIQGVKTFSSLPKIPLTPIANEDAASKAYADGVGNTTMTAANAARDKAQQWAENPEDTEVEAGKYSALHWAAKAQTSAESIEQSADMLIRHEAEIATLENVINSANINQETTATASGVDTVALPKTAANTGMQVQMFGQSAENLVVNGNIESGLIHSKSDGAGSVSTLTLNTTSPISGTKDERLVVTTPSVNRPFFDLITNPPKISIGNKLYYSFNYKVNSGILNLLISQGDVNLSLLSTGDLTGSGRYASLLTCNGLEYIGTSYYNKNQVIDVQFDNFQLINLTATFGAGNEPTKEQCDVLFANYFEGSDNVLGTGRVRSVGKNLLNPLNFNTTNLGSTLAPQNYSLSLNVIQLTSATSGVQCGLNQNFKFIAGTYIVKAQSITYDSGTVGIQIYFTDSNNVDVISNVSINTTTGSSFTLTEAQASAVKKILLYKANGSTVKTVIITGLQIERSSVATSFEPYRQSILQLTTPELRSNRTTKDEIRKGTNGYELVKRVGVGTLGAEKAVNGGFEDNSSWTTTTGWTISGGTANFSPVGSYQYIRQPIALVVGKLYKLTFTVKNYVAGGVKIQPGNEANGTERTANGTYTEYRRATDSFIYIYANTTFNGSVDDISVKEAIEADGVAHPAGITATELGSNIHYTLATPTISPIAHAGLLNSNSNGTAYFEPIIADAGVYSSNLAVQLTDYPISSFESIRKYANGTYTELSLTTGLTIAPDGLSFTHTGLNPGDLVMFTYTYNKESICRSMTFTYPISNSNPYYNVTNSVPLTSGYYTSTTARASVPEGVRKTGLILTYETAAGVWYTERYIGTATDTTSWTTASNWEVGVLRIASVTDTTEYAEITI